jgi:hypothetical protein
MHGISSDVKYIDAQEAKMVNTYKNTKKNRKITPSFNKQMQSFILCHELWCVNQSTTLLDQSS